MGMHSKSFIVLLFLVFGFINVSGQNLPLGYISYFSHDCDNATLFNFLRPEHEAEWMIIQDAHKNILRIKPSEDSINSTIPGSRGILDNMILGDYILEFEMKSVATGSADTAGFCFIGPARSREIYYSFLFSKDTVYFFSVQNDSILCRNSLALKISDNLWNKIRVERNILTRTLHITLNGESANSISFSDRALVMGYIGFGSHRTTSFLRNIRLYAPTVIQENPFYW